MTPNEILKIILNLARWGKPDQRKWESYIQVQCTEDERITLLELAAELYQNSDENLDRLEWIIEVSNPVSDHSLRGNIRFLHNALKDF